MGSMVNPPLRGQNVLISHHFSLDSRLALHANQSVARDSKSARGRSKKLLGHRRVSRLSVGTLRRERSTPAPPVRLVGGILPPRQRAVPNVAPSVPSAPRGCTQKSGATGGGPSRLPVMDTFGVVFCNFHLGIECGMPKALCGGCFHSAAVCFVTDDRLRLTSIGVNTRRDHCRHHRKSHTTLFSTPGVFRSLA